MITGTLIGVLVIPGLYFFFASLVDGKKLLQDEVHTSLTDSIAMTKTQRIRLKKHSLKGRLKLQIKKIKPKN